MERLEAEDYAAAAALIEKLAERLPDSPEVYSYLAYTYRKLGQEDAALAHYQRALFLEPGRRDLRAEPGALYLARGNVREADAQLAEIDRLCFLSCREYRALKTEIEDYSRSSEERRVGNVCVSTLRARWSPDHYKQTTTSSSTHQS